MGSLNFSSPKIKKAPKVEEVAVETEDDNLSYMAGTLHNEENETMNIRKDTIEVKNLADLITTEDEDTYLADVPVGTKRAVPMDPSLVEGPYETEENFPSVGEDGKFYALKSGAHYAYVNGSYDLVIQGENPVKVVMLQDSTELDRMSEDGTANPFFRYVLPDGTIFKYSAEAEGEGRTKEVNGVFVNDFFEEMDMMDEPEVMSEMVVAMQKQIKELSVADDANKATKLKYNVKLSKTRAKRKKAAKKAKASRKRNKK